MAASRNRRRLSFAREDALLARRFPLFTSSCGGRRGQECVGGCEMAQACIAEARHALGRLIRDEESDQWRKDEHQGHEPYRQT